MVTRQGGWETATQDFSRGSCATIITGLKPRERRLTRGEEQVCAGALRRDILWRLTVLYSISASGQHITWRILHHIRRAFTPRSPELV